MARLLKTLLYFVTRAVQIAVLAEVALLLVNLDLYKPRLERAASDALGMEVRIEGPVRLSVIAGPRVALRDVHVRSRGHELASVAYARLGLDLTPLRDRQSPEPTIALGGVRLLVERDRRGFNFAPGGRPDRSPAAFELARLRISDATLRYRDRRSGARLEAAGCDLASDGIHSAGANNVELWRALSFHATVACREIRTTTLALQRVRATVNGENGVVELDPIAMRVLGGNARGSLRADFSGSVPRVQARFALSQFRIEQLFETLPAGRKPRGTLDLSLALAFAGTSRAQILRAAEGNVSLRGSDLVLEGVDLDEVIARFESSQRLKLLDFGALIYAGPLGLVLSRGVNLASAIPDTGGRTRIAMLVSDWELRGGVAHARDVALATGEHRIALRGRVHLVDERFENVVFAVVGPDGCARLSHTVSGPFDEPELDRPGALASLAGPVLRLFKAVGDCEVFYAGAVPAPK